MIVKNFGRGAASVWELCVVVDGMFMFNFVRRGIVCLGRRKGAWDGRSIILRGWARESSPPLPSTYLQNLTKPPSPLSLSKSLSLPIPVMALGGSGYITRNNRRLTSSGLIAGGDDLFGPSVDWGA